MSSEHCSPPKLLALIIAGLGYVASGLPPVAAQPLAADIRTAEPKNPPPASETLPQPHEASQDSTDGITQLHAVEVVAPERTDDEKGADDVFHKNVSNVYMGKEEIERYRIDAAGDVLKGLNGVYNMNTRTAGGAITPNIRGISGKGRIPVTIDGTEQTVDVWQNNYGVGDRNYVDPALFRSIAVDKSPDLSRNMKPGVGGSIAIRTIEASDIVKNGDTWALQLKLEGANNTIKPQNKLDQFLGKDYRRVGGTADGAGGGFQNGELSPYALLMDDVDAPRDKGSADNWRFGGDKSAMLAAAFQTDITDGLLSYAYRNKGNYFAGKNGVGDYLDNPIYDMDNCGIDCKSSAAFVPNMGEMYPAGAEVFNSNTRTETLLAKNNWHFGDNQKISLQYMRTDVRFGEINPFQSTWALNFYELNPDFIDQPKPPQTQNIDSKIRSDTWKLGYEFKPEDNRWVDLEASLWRVKTDSVRHQSGGMSLAVNTPDTMHDAWYWCNVRNTTPWSMAESTCEELGEMWGFDKSTTLDEIIAESDAIFGTEGKKIISGAQQSTQVTRNGANLSNRFKLAPNFNLTLGADIQREKLGEENTIINSDDLFNIYGTVTGLAKLAGPRSGKRQEWGMTMTTDWQPTSWLNVQAGVRYTRFKGEDTAMSEERQKRNDQFAWGGGFNEYIDAYSLPYWEIGSAEFKADYENHMDLSDQWANTIGKDSPLGDPAAAQRLQESHNAFYKQYGVSTSSVRSSSQNGQTIYYQFRPDIIIPFRNGKPDSSASTLTPGMFDEKVSTPQATEGEYYKYLMGGQQPGSITYEEWKLLPSTTRQVTTAAGEFDPNGDHSGALKAITRPITDDQKWARPEKLKGDAWAPMLALTVSLSPQQRLFARYAEMTRFPSIYEATSTAIDGLVSMPTAPGFDLKPERSQNWEIGYAFDFTPYWDKLDYGDIRLSYFSNTIRNVIDTTEARRITQYDKKIVKGLEFQSRIDTGGFFASAGVTYRLKNVTCDADTAFAFDMYLGRIPECIEGGFGVTRFYQSQQPKYSINVDLGTRLLDRKLELGVRGIYHSDVKTSQYDRLLQQGLADIFTFTGKPYHWRPTLLLDAYGRYQINDTLSVNASVTNLTNRYYLDPMSNVAAPGPGRTVMLGMQALF